MRTVRRSCSSRPGRARPRRRRSPGRLAGLALCAALLAGCGLLPTAPGEVSVELEMTGTADLSTSPMGLDVGYRIRNTGEESVYLHSNVCSYLTSLEKQQDGEWQAVYWPGCFLLARRSSVELRPGEVHERSYRIPWTMMEVDELPGRYRAEFLIGTSRTPRPGRRLPLADVLLPLETRRVEFDAPRR